MITLPEIGDRVFCFVLAHECEDVGKGVGCTNCGCEK